MVKLEERSAPLAKVPVRPPRHERARTVDDEAELVLDRWKDIGDDLIEDRKNYWLNLAFYQGDQWVRWNPSSRSPELWMSNSERFLTVSNQIEHRVNRLLGALAERDLVFDVKASAADDATLAGASLSENLLESRRDECDWESIREQTDLNELLGGTAFITVEWDPSQGRLWESGETGQMIGEGEVVISPWSIATFGLEPGSASKAAARYGIGCRTLPPEQAQAHYNLPEKPQADAAQQFSPTQYRLLQTSAGATTARKLTSVFIMYERPNALCPAGRVVHVINRKVVAREDWPFPFDHLNVEVSRQTPMPDTYRGKTIVTSARPIQVQYNAQRSNIMEHLKRAGNARLMVAKGTLDPEFELTDEAGEAVEWDNDEGPMPQYQTPAALPRSLTQIREDLLAELDDILLSHAVSRGISPGDRTSGLAVAQLGEYNNTPLGPWGRRKAMCWGGIGRMTLQLYAANAHERRTAVVFDERQVPHQFSWSGARLRGQHSVVVPRDVTMPQSRVQLQALWGDLISKAPTAFANIDAATLARMMGISDEKFFAQILDAQAALAQWENSRMAVDEVMLPQPYEHHDTHIAEHNEFRANPHYRLYPQETRDHIEAHIQAHQRYIEEAAAKTRALNEAVPGLGGMPQADHPIGSAIPLPAKQMAALGPGPTPGKAPT